VESGVFFEVPVALIIGGDIKPIPIFCFSDDLCQKSFAPNCNTLGPYCFADKTIVVDGFHDSFLMCFSQNCFIGQTWHFNKAVEIQQAEPLALADKFILSAPEPIHWVAHDARAHHVEIHVTQAIRKMVAAIDHG
jgi:hypothetical protein